MVISSLFFLTTCSSRGRRPIWKCSRN